MIVVGDWKWPWRGNGGAGWKDGGDHVDVGRTSSATLADTSCSVTSSTPAAPLNNGDQCKDGELMIIMHWARKMSDGHDLGLGTGRLTNFVRKLVSIAANALLLSGPTSPV